MTTPATQARPCTLRRATVRGHMSVLAAYRPRLEALLRDLAADQKVPGAVCGIWFGDETEVVTHGVANVATGTPVSRSTLFQIGSISKIYTATLIMQAVSAGVIALDEPVRAQLQEFMVADPGATIEITPRHLLTHTSGLEGDHLIDTGWNADALARYVATLAVLGQIHPTDATYSFCNTGYGVLGRMLEVVTGEHFDRILRRRLTRPLGCRATVTLPQHALLHDVAVGHVKAEGGEPTRQGRWVLTRSNGPMGGIMAPADELLAFARLHTNEGRGADGVDLLAPAAVGAMQQSQVDCPVPGEVQALGWTVRRWGDLACLGQDADTFGQRALLRVVPERDFAVCMMANSRAGAALGQALLERVSGDLLDVPPDSLGLADGGAPVVTPSDIAAYAGTYDRLHQRIVVSGGDGKLRLSTDPSGVLRALGVSSVDLDVARVADAPDDGRLVVAGTDPSTGQCELAVFTPAEGPQPAGLYLAGRLHRRSG